MMQLLVGVRIVFYRIGDMRYCYDGLEGAVVVLEQLKEGGR